MSEESTPRPQPQEPSGAAKKWIAGAAVAAVVLGGGYLAYATLGQNRAQTQNAYDTASVTDTSAPYESGAAPAGADAAPLPEAEEETQTAGASPAPRRSAQRAAPAEAVIGVSSDDAEVQTAAYESDEITVTPSRRPVWARTPSARRLSALYPERALERGREGEASLSCTVDYGGALDCVRVSEYPARSGFGNAALRVARTFRHASERADGSAAEGSQVNLRVLFRLEDEPRRGARRYASN